MQRRTYLQVIGVSAVMQATSDSVRADSDTSTDSGYGAGGFGEGGYGESESTTDGGDTEIGDPVVEYLRLSDTSPPNPHVDLVTEWVVSHPDGELAAVDISIRTSVGGLIDTITHTVSGSRAEGTDETEIKQGAGSTYVVTLQVTDSAGTTTSKMEPLETA